MYGASGSVGGTAIVERSPSGRRPRRRSAPVGAQSTSRPGPSARRGRRRPSRRTTTTVRTDGRRRDRLVGDRLERDDRPAPEEAIGGDQVGRLERVQPGGDRRCRVAAEDRREDRPQPAEREDGDRRLGAASAGGSRRGSPRRRRPRRAVGRRRRTSRSSSRPGERPDRAVLALPGQRRVVGSAGGPRLGRRDRVVERAAGPPARPGRPAGQVEDGRRAALPGEPRSSAAGPQNQPGSSTARAWRPSSPAAAIGPEPAATDEAAQRGSRPGPSAKAARGPRCPVGRRPPVALTHGAKPTGRRRWTHQARGIGSRTALRKATRGGGLP